MGNRTKKYYFIAALMLVWGSNLTAQETYDKGFEISKNLEIFSNVYQNLHQFYVDDVDPGKTMKVAIDAMLASMDPYTNYYPESAMEDVKLQLMGEYGGVGALILQFDSNIYISQPYEGLPADLVGLKAGDRIVEVNGESTKGKTTADVSSAMRGQAGTEVTLKVERNGKMITKTLTRKEIKMKAVPYYGMMKDNIGYIKLNEFTHGSAQEVKQAFRSLKAEHPEMKGVVLDLRGNGGGLLNEAVDIVNIWEKKGQLVVETKGKIKAKNLKSYTSSTAEDLQIPVAVLIDGSSASASEIVSGSLQDLDRAVIVGNRSYGKGLVQNILPMNYGSQMKVTVSKYYIPSGRCIQAINYSDRDENGRAKKLPDSLKTAFQTHNGRTVYDGAGIEPDVEVEQEYMSSLTAELVRRSCFFEYANIFCSKHETIPAPEAFEITDEIWNDFATFVKSKNITYKTYTEEVLANMRQAAEDEHYLESIEKDIKDLEEKFKQEKANDLTKYRKEISMMLKSELLARYYYEKGQIQGWLPDDPCALKAIEILNNTDQYNKILGKK